VEAISSCNGRYRCFPSSGERQPSAWIVTRRSSRKRIGS
jgi:hypothetical protein